MTMPIFPGILTTTALCLAAMGDVSIPIKKQA